MCSRKIYLKLLLFYLLFTSLLFAREYSLEEKFAQMFILGFQGTIYTEFNNFYDNFPWGGYIFYSNYDSKKNGARNLTNINQAQLLLNKIKKPANDTAIKPFLAIDQEGGNYQIKLTEPRQADLASQQKIGQINKKETTLKWAQSSAELLCLVGINLNLAPVVDITENLSRSFGNEPSTVIKHSEIFINEHRKKNIPCTLKHFPGKGIIKETGKIKYNKDVDIAPFNYLIKNKKTDLIMLSALTYPELDQENPAFLSKKITNLLRKNLGFKGIIITDDLSKLKVKNLTDAELEQLIINLIEAGNDLLLFANNPPDQDLAKKLKKAVKNIIANKKISEKRIEASFQRILELKQKYKIEPAEIYLNYTI